MNPTRDTGEDLAGQVVAQEPVAIDSVDKAENKNKKNEKELVVVSQQTNPSLRSAWNDVTSAWSNLFGAMRYKSVRALPGFVVNNSSNLLGLTHVLTEVMMFKASLKGGVLVDKSTGPIDYTIQAFKRVFSQSLEGSKVKNSDFLDSIKGKPLTNSLKYITDTNAATEREIALQKGVARNAVKLGNAWQTRSTLSGLIVWSLSALIPDKKESDTEVENMVVLADTNKPAYVLERLRQAVWFPEWPSHKRQMIGLGIMASGIFSTLGAWRNHVKVPGLGPKYELNAGYLFTSLVTFLSSLPLLFASDNQRGFAGFGSIMLGRLAFLPGSFAKKIKGGEQGAGWYIGASSSFQVENVAQALIGGAEKLPDGTIIDHNEARDNAKQKAQDIKQQKKSYSKAMLGISDSAPPTTQVSAIRGQKLAMPERMEAKQQEIAEMAM